MDTATTFQFKQFELAQDQCTMKVNTDGVLLGAWAPVEKHDMILDIGTGTGVIANMLAQRQASATIHAVEINEASAEQARQNTIKTPWKDRVTIICDNIQSFARTSKDQYDLIVCNPPFFSGGTFSESADRNEVRTTIKLPHGALLSSVRTLLKSTGTFALILPYIEGLRFQEMAKNYSLYLRHTTEVRSMAEKPTHRLLMLMQKSPTECTAGELIIQNSANSNDYTAAYMELTKDFYTFM